MNCRHVAVPLVLLASLAGAALCSCQADPIPASQRWPAATSWRAVERAVDGTRLRLIDTGTGPAVVFVHGLAASMYSWRSFLGPVAAAGHRVVAFDGRGFGYSEKPAAGYGNQDYVRLLIALLDTLRIDEAVVVGHSMGGQIAAEAALAHPERVLGLVLIASTGAGVRYSLLTRLAGWPLIGTLGAALHSRELTARVLRGTFADPTRVTADEIDQYYAPLTEPGAGRALHRVMREFHFDALRHRLRSIRAPTLLIWGANDRVVPPSLGRQMSLELPRGALVMVRDAGHSLPDERPDAVLEPLLAFLRTGLPIPPPDLALEWR